MPEAGGADGAGDDACGCGGGALFRGSIRGAGLDAGRGFSRGCSLSALGNRLGRSWGWGARCGTESALGREAGSARRNVSEAGDGRCCSTSGRANTGALPALISAWRVRSGSFGLLGTELPAFPRPRSESFLGKVTGSLRRGFSSLRTLSGRFPATGEGAGSLRPLLLSGWRPRRSRARRAPS